MKSLNLIEQFQEIAGSGVETTTYNLEKVMRRPADQSQGDVRTVS